MHQSSRQPGYGHNSQIPGAALNIDQLVDDLEAKGLEWADEKAGADALEDSRKSVLAECLLRSDGKTVGEREARALTDPRYTQHLDALKSARRRENRARIKYEVARVRCELLRTNASTARAAMNMR